MAIESGGLGPRTLIPRILLISSWQRGAQPDEGTKETEPQLVQGDAPGSSGNLSSPQWKPANHQLLEILLPHPSQPSVVVAFLWSNSTLYELNQFTRDVGLTSVLLRSPEFVLGNGALLAATPFDPLFIFLALLYRHATEFFVPFSQLISQSDYSQEVRRNLTWLASVPEVTKRISLIADIRSAGDSTIGDHDTRKGESPSALQNSWLKSEFFRLNADKARTFLQRKHAKLLKTILGLRLPFKDCVVFGEKTQYSPVPKDTSRGPYTTVNSWKNDHLNPQKGNVAPGDVTEKIEVDLAAAHRMVDEILCGYLPKGLAAAFKQPCNKQGRSRTTKREGNGNAVSCTLANVAEDNETHDGRMCGSGDLFPSPEVLSDTCPTLSAASAGREKSTCGFVDGTTGKATKTEETLVSSGLHDETTKRPEGRKKRLRAHAAVVQAATSPQSETNSADQSESDTKENASRQAETRQVARQADEQKAAGNTDRHFEDEGDTANSTCNKKCRKENSQREGSFSKGNAAKSEADNAMSKTKAKGGTRLSNQTLISSFFRKKH
ncbi:Ydr279p family (RNase H2 complex component) protein [Toxoplasma gondii ME49]|uniref:RNase H2 complex component, Ydr279p like protein n=2 Tax=Toxoplasma gondii TaxID=5811 RepID=B6KL09_TOXGV|nr:Ydr279p family (RNase H2 complex component) protein [Toxoplasma gondii ME49]EPT28104.1 Ydr279p family (RNase H2 complex component) protein [Toxoplasma gondii ME49]ESS33996.1 Ydr279p family (RNase H2 complex component) protein [Toxoplasma gondii VEG]CEL76087.1 TPA: RNase H2 complex component, Ydr279p like protein [Toxoplasma gondii VEG]|eukprot:XP_002368532.1 Ydr279p family (RNase H2 complex component) protein [Toxoplasma gondii ME49]